MASKNIEYLFPDVMRRFFWYVSGNQNKIQEIRLRINQPVYIMEDGQERFLDKQGYPTGECRNAKLLTGEEMKCIMNHICRYSLYAYEDEIRQGFLSVQGGHRVGIVGQAVLEEQHRLRTIKYVSGMNIRIAHEIKGAADWLLPYVYENGKLQNTLILSPPGCGKTTLLRDMIRAVSEGNVYGQGMSVGVVDERSEIAGCVQGIPQNDVGMRTDVLDRCPKAEGMMMLIRSMTPGAVAIDELGEPEEWRALLSASYCGTGIIATMHGGEIEDYLIRREICIPGREDFFRRCVVLRRINNRCVIQKIHKKENGEDWKCIFQRS